jgi:signal transduction histidine kinase/ActR/RegA family two-component response regulator
MRVRSHLFVAFVAVLVPMVVFAFLVMVAFGRQQRAAVERGALDTARALINALDESLRRTITTLEALAAAESLEIGDVRAFDGLARRVLRSQREWYDVIVFSPDGYTVVDTQFPYGSSRRRASEPASLAETLATRRPVAGDIARGPAGQYAIPIRVPVMRGERVEYILTAVLKPESLLNVLQRHRVERDWVITAFDRRKNTVARTRSGAEFLGRSVSPEFSALLDRGAADGWAVTRTHEGQRVYTAYARSAVTGWGIGLGIPEGAVDGPLHRSVWAIAGGGVVCIAIALVLGSVVGRRITTPMAALAGAAQRFGEGDAFAASAERGVTEVDDVRRAFSSAAALVRRRADEAEAAARAKDEFLAILSHELRTPLNAVYGWARMLQTGQLRAEQLNHALDVIVKQSNAQLQLIDDLLDVSRIATGKMRLDIQRFDLERVITEAVDALRPAAAAKDIRLDCEPAVDIGPLHGDPERLQQVVWNLVSNAVKFTQRGGRVNVRARRVNGEVEIVVQDTGIGITADVLPYIFDRFRQADSSSTRVHSGLGVGLALVKHLVELHGGNVTAHSAGSARGATFVVTLPVAHPAGTAAMSRSGDRPEESVSATARLDGVRVLVVDDDRDALDLAVAVLTAAGATVRAALSSDDGFKILASWRPDVVIADIEMPVEDGYTFIRRVRALDDDAGGRTPAVALTAYARSKDRDRAVNAGYTMHVPKPLDPGEFTAIISSLTARH